jgi:hypothetical protein
LQAFELVHFCRRWTFWTCDVGLIWTYLDWTLCYTVPITVIINSCVLTCYLT